jgi:microcompartment protein CcmL/EutN
VNPSIHSLGMVEFNSIAVGIEASDFMVKAALVDIVFVKTICPGKFLAAVHGDVAAVQASVAAGLAAGADAVVDHFVIPSISPLVVTGLCGALEIVRGAAIGVVETFSAASTILAADVAVKAADVDLALVRLAMGLGGKAYFVVSGDVGPVEMAVGPAAAQASADGLLVRKTIIPSMSPQLLPYIL